MLASAGGKMHVVIPNSDQGRNFVRELMWKAKAASKYGPEGGCCGACYKLTKFVSSPKSDDDDETMRSRMPRLGDGEYYVSWLDIEGALYFDVDDTDNKLEKFEKAVTTPVPPLGSLEMWGIAGFPIDGKEQEFFVVSAVSCLPTVDMWSGLAILEPQQQEREPSCLSWLSRWF
jgi:hypothetical protein